MDTNDLDKFLSDNNIKYNRTFNEYLGYKENGRLRYNLCQNFDAGRYYYIDICYGNLITFEYESEKYNYISTILFEEVNEWKNVDKKKLFEIILEHMNSYILSDDE